MRKFDINRFWHIFAYDIKQIRYTYGKALLVALGAPIIYWMMNSIFGATYDSWGRIGIIEIDLILILMMAPSRLYARVNQGNRGIYYAMLPASKIEKYLSMWLICAIILPIVLIFGLLLVDTLLAILPFGAIENTVSKYDSPRFLWQQPKGIFNVSFSQIISKTDGNKIGEFLNDCLVWQMFISFFMLTNTLFKKSKVIFSILTLWGVLICYSAITLPWAITHILEFSDGFRWPLVNMAYALLAVVLYYITYRRLDKMAY